LVNDVAVSVENGDGKVVCPQMTPDVLDQVLIGQARHDLVEDTIVTPTLPAMVEGLSRAIPLKLIGGSDQLLGNMVAGS
jgi:hypothetical protein